MGNECIVMIPVKQQDILQGKILFKKEWADILMNAETIQENGDSVFYKTKGEAVNFTGERVVVKLKNGIMVSVPLYCVRLCACSAGNECGL